MSKYLLRGMMVGTRAGLISGITQQKHARMPSRSRASRLHELSGLSIREPNIGLSTSDIGCLPSSISASQGIAPGRNTMLFSSRSGCAVAQTRVTLSFMWLGRSIRPNSAVYVMQPESGVRTVTPGVRKISKFREMSSIKLICMRPCRVVIGKYKMNGSESSGEILMKTVADS
jgi:hypothetical protein